MKKLMVRLAILIATLVGLSGLAAPVWADALDSVGVDDICQHQGEIPDELFEVAGCKLAEDDTAMPAVVKMIEVALSLVGIVAVIVIVYGGITFVISTGDAAKTTRARNTILYAVVGMGVALLSYAIVHFVSQSIWG